MDWVGFLNTQGEAVSFNIQDRGKTVIFITSQKNQEKTRLKPNMVIMGGWILQNPCQNQVKTTLDFWVFFQCKALKVGTWQEGLFPSVFALGTKYIDWLFEGLRICNINA